jgi:major membrane immunogen (membrane-anchored lipoprotein)
MKKLCIAAMAALFLLASCGKKSEGTHTHDDGTEHADHEAVTEQEEFNAADSAHHEHDSTEHQHPHDTTTTHQHPH